MIDATVRMGGERRIVSRVGQSWRVRAAIGILLATGVIVFLAWPMLFTSAGMAQDWVNHLWYMWRQSVLIERSHQPSLFLNEGGSVFYPLYAFYGGTIYALAGGLTALFGNAAVEVYVASYLAGFAVAYGGWYWLGRMAGLGRWTAQAPGLLYISAGYFLTLIYARGDWPEFVAVSTLPLLVASALSVMRAERLRILPALALAGSAIVFFGSHSLTILWGITALALLAAVVAIAVPPARASITRAGLTRVALIAVPASLVNAWYLFPALAYGQRTAIANTYEYARSLRATNFLVSAGNLFTFSRASAAPETPDFVLALPVLAIAFVFAGIAYSLPPRGGRRAHAAWRRVLWIVAGFTLLVGVVMTHPGIILSLPHPYTLLQFGYRLETYVLLGLSASMLAILVLARTAPPRWRGGIWVAAAAVLVASSVGAIQQVDGYPTGSNHPIVVVPDRYVVFAPNNQPPQTAGGLGNYDDASLPLINPVGAPGIEFPSDQIRRERVTIAVDLLPGEIVRTNLTGAPYLVRVTGARVVGRDPSGHMVLQIGAAKGNSGERISLSRSDRLPVVLGRTVTLLALLFLLCASLAILAQRVWGRLARMGR
jgi:hypothetical protein